LAYQQVVYSEVKKEENKEYWHMEMDEFALSMAVSMHDCR